MSDRRVGVLGGTFDPIHLGHLVVASEVHAALALDTVIIVPTLQQPFKGPSAATPQQRLDMCRLAVMDDDRLEVSDVDIARGTETFTVDTLADLHAQLPDAELFFIAGADALARLDEWRDASRLKELARFVGVARPGHGEPRSDATHVVVETPEVGVSSTVVRRRAATGAPLRYLVPDRVAEYIVEHGLYLGGLDG